MKDIPTNVINDYFAYRQTSNDLSDSLKEEIIENQIEKLKRSHWKRWTPGLGLICMAYDGMTGKHVLLDHIYGPLHNTANMIYNSGIGATIGIAIANNYL